MSNGIKKIAWAFGIFILLIGLNTYNVQAKPDRGISLQVFYDELSYHGDWINNPDYGYVWRPNVGRDFRPYYTNGHWVMTEYGNTWVSDYEWGWAPFHYGRWFYDSYDGWIWAPDTEWGPAWVTWRTGGGYYGWAPLPPRISININIGRRYYVPNNYWVFIPQRCIYYPSYSRYWEPRRNVYIINNTTIINNVYTNRNVRYYSGPGRDDVRRATRQDVPVYRVADGTRPGSDRVSRDAVNIYRPDVSRGDNSSAPRSIANNSPRPSRADNSPNRTLDGNSNGRTDLNRSNSSSPRTDSNISNDPSSRPSRSDNTNSRGGTVDSNPPSVRTETSPSRSESSRPSGSNYPSRTERSESSQPASSPRTESSSSSRSERVERNSPSTQSSSPSRTQPSSSSRSERAERSAPSSSPTRSVERSQPRSQPSSSSSSRGGGGSSNSGRPTRGGN